MASCSVSACSPHAKMVSVNSQAAHQLLLSLSVEGLHPADFQQLTDLCESCAPQLAGLLQLLCSVPE